jgi:hypothetical protein
MTEQEWLTSTDPTPMLRFLQEQQVSERKMRLLACACCRLIWEHLPDPRSRQAVDVAERFADGRATPKELARARNSAGLAPSREAQAAWAAYWATNQKPGGPLDNVFTAAAAAPAKHAAGQAPRQKHAAWDTAHAASVREQAELIREVIGNPFRPGWIDPRWLAWEGGVIVRLAEGIYEERAFERMPVLGDALEEAGCTQAAVLEHCRGGGAHVRGCWLLDLILGKP